MKRINLYPPSFLLTRQMAIFSKGEGFETPFRQAMVSQMLSKENCFWTRVIRREK